MVLLCRWTKLRTSFRSNEEEARYSAMTMDEDLRNMGLNITNITIPYVDTHLNISVFSGIIASVFLLGLLRALMFFKVAVDASQNLHNKMFSSILRSHIGFFDTNPVGKWGFSLLAPLAIGQRAYVMVRCPSCAHLLL